MARPRRELPVSSSLAAALLRFLRAQGIDPSPLASRLGLEGAEERDEVQVTPSVLDELLAAAGELLGDPALALRLPAELSGRRYGEAELAARASATVGEALSRAARYAPLLHPRLSCRVEPRGPEILFRVEAHPAPRGQGREATELGLAFALSVCRAGSGHPLLTTRAWFAHARPADLGPLHLFFATRALSFGCEDSGFALPEADARASMQAGDPRLLATAEDLADAKLSALPRSSRFADTVAARLASRGYGAEVEAVASDLHMSARTLQRRLEDEGASFTELQVAARRAQALVLLGDATLSLQEIAFRLGFSDLAAFSRAFKRWTGKPPGQHRRGG